MMQVDYEIRRPDNVQNLVIQEEFFYVKQNGQERKVRLHDYPELYGTPHLYETLYGELEEKSHIVLPSLLQEQVTQCGKKMEDLTLLEIGAGSGAMGNVLSQLGVSSVVGIDIVPEAAIAAEREYPGVYENYHIEDLANLQETTRQALLEKRFTCILCGTALGFNHITAPVWGAAFNMLEPNSWVAFNVQQQRWESQGEDAFATYHPWVQDESIFKITQVHKYQHRFYLDGRPLYYYAVLGRKMGNIS